MKHPYYSSKSLYIDSYRETWDWYLSHERECEAYKAQKERKSFTLSKRLADDDSVMRQEEAKGGDSNKRMKANDGKMIAAGASSS